MYKQLMDEGLINESFGYEQVEMNGVNAVLFSGESQNPKRVAEVIRKHVRSALKNGIDPEEFEIAKKAV